MSTYILYIHKRIIYGMNLCQHMKLFQFLIGFIYVFTYYEHAFNIIIFNIFTMAGRYIEFVRYINIFYK